MSINPNPIDPSTLTITQYQQLAAEFSADLDNVLSKLPKRGPARQMSKKFVSARVSASLEFLSTAIAGVEAYPELQGPKKLDVNVGRDTLQFIEAFRPVVDKMARLQKELQFALNERQAVLAEYALQTYEIARALARDETNTAMVALVANLRRDLGRAEALRKNAAKKTAFEKNVAGKPVAGKPVPSEPLPKAA